MDAYAYYYYVSMHNNQRKRIKKWCNPCLLITSIAQKLLIKVSNNDIVLRLYLFRIIELILKTKHHPL